nr:MAG TPA: hypothetical protein [Caudoviricetes sp.]
MFFNGGGCRLNPAYPYFHARVIFSACGGSMDFGAPSGCLRY